MRRKLILGFLCMCFICGCENTKTEIEDSQESLEESLEKLEESVEELENFVDQMDDAMPEVNDTIEFEMDSIVIPEYEYDKDLFAVRYFCSSDIYVEDSILGTSGTLERLLSNGIETDIDLMQMLDSCVVSDELELRYKNARIIVKIVNPYKNPVPASKCYICYIRIDDITGIVKGQNNIQCGITTLDDVKSTFYEPYSETDSKLLYKTSAILPIKGFDFEFSLNAGEELLYDDACRDVKFTFENKVLKCIEIEAAALLYNGLHDNVKIEALLDASKNTISGYVELRDNILDKLKEAFTEQSLNVQINDITGEIVIDTGILFKTNEYELSEEGRAYIDDFCNVYVNVILNKNILDKIDCIEFGGHTDSTGSYEYNMDLSKKRAESVLKYCLESIENGLSDEQKSEFEKLAEVKGYSYTDLVFTQSGVEDKAASRRVAIKFFIKTN